jgi:molybdate transport system substrate-binding protein
VTALGAAIWPTTASSTRGETATVSVAVAANFAAPAQKVAAAFEQATGHRVLLSVGSTGRFYAQVRQGAPFHVLLAADEATPSRLAAQGWAVPESRFTYAVGRLVLWSPEEGRIDPRGQVLREGRIGRLAVADPRLAPYGAAAVQVMERLGLLDTLRPRWVQGESIGQAYQFVSSGNAHAGFVALAQVWEHGRVARGSGWVVPAHLHDPIRQDAVLLRPGRSVGAAHAFLDFLKSPPMRDLIAAHGYER